MSLIKIDGVQSLSAPTKAQKDAAVYMLGSKGHAIVSVLDKLSRAKEIRAPHLDGLLKLMKEATDEEIIKFVASAAGKKTLLNAKAFATAKTLATSIKALRLIRVPQKWIEGHSDIAAARAKETKEIRARRTAGNKPEKPIKLDNPGAPESTTVDKKVIDAKKGSATPGTKGTSTDFEFVGSKSTRAGAIQLDFLQPFNGHKWSVTVSRQKDYIACDYKSGSSYQTAESFLQRGVIATKGVVTWEHQQPGSASFRFADEAQAKKYMSWLKKQKAQTIDYKNEPKITVVKADVKHTPTNKSDITLVDELAEVTARKISAKPLQVREEYFKALRNVLQKNLPKAIVSTISNGVTVTTKRDYIIALEDNAWTIKIGITGKSKKIGATFDIVDLLGMIDKSILRPKSDVSNKRPEPPYFERIKKNAAGEYTTQIQANENVAYAAHFKREGDTFVFSTPVYSDVQRFITQGMSETGIKWETFTGRSVTFSKTDADKFEKWVKSIKRSQPLTSNRTFPAIAPKPRGGGMSM